MRAAAATGVVLLLFVAGSAASAPRLRTDDPYWVAGGRLIGFSGGYSDDRDYWEAYVANADGSARRRVGGLVVSADGRFTASMIFPPQDDCVVDFQRLDGKPLRSFRISAGGCWDGPVWSPDNRAVLGEVDVSRGDGDTAIYLVDLRHGPHRVSRTRRQDTAPDWSPDSSRIVFVSCPTMPPFDCAIVVANRDGSRPHAIVRHVEGGTGYDVADPVWSPDGRYVAYSTPYGEEPASRTDPPPRRWGIYVAGADGRTSRRIAVTPYMISDPGVAWSARSRSIAFSDTRGIWTVRVDGSRLHRHTTRSDDHSRLSWAPATSILFVKDDVIYKIRPGGPVKRVVP